MREIQLEAEKDKRKKNISKWDKIAKAYKNYVQDRALVCIVIEG